MHGYEYPRPAVTVDVALFGLDAPGRLRVLLIRRKNAPFRGRWALPGGFVDPDEELEDAARRELREETGLTAGPLLQLGAYGAPGRDPRGHTVGIAYLGVVAELDAGRAGDDAAACQWRSAARPPALAFDHADMLRDARRRLAELARSRDGFARALFAVRSAAADRLRRAIR